LAGVGVNPTLTGIRQIPSGNRPGANLCPGSNWSFTARISAAPGTGPHTSTGKIQKDALRTSAASQMSN